MEAEEEAPGFYQYASLRHATSFRIAALLPGHGDEPVQCTLEEVQWSDERQYEAVSYAWGDPSPKARILVHGKILEVTRNLQNALLHLRHEEASRYIWVDAICTNQTDIPERGAQVRQMRRIFENATSVLIWLGPDNEAGQAALAVRSVQHIASRVCQQLDIALDSLTSVEQIYHTILFRNRHRLALPSACDDLTRTMWDAVRWFYQHAYFTRVWVIQEINANRRRPTLCGKQVIAWEAVELVAGYMVLASTFASTGAVDGGNTFCWWASTAPSELQQAQNWLHILYLASNFVATDARDVVYGLRGMMECRAGGQLLDPDYHKTTLQVYRDVVEASLLNYKNTNALLYVSAVEAGRPSWIPFWNEAMLFRNPFRFGQPMPWKPAGDSEAHWAVDREDYTLELEGFYLGRVQSAEAYRETVFRGGPPASNKGNVEAVASTWQRILSLLAAAQNDNLPLSEDTLTACAASFCYGQDETCKPAAEAKLARNFVAYLELVLSREDFDKYVGQSFSDFDKQGDGATFGKPVWDFEYPESSFFVMEDSSMGCCIASIASGDAVFVPLGCTYPLVLRADGDCGFRIRGYCFVHGAMHGERQSSETVKVRIHINTLPRAVFSTSYLDELIIKTPQNPLCKQARKQDFASLAKAADMIVPQVQQDLHHSLIGKAMAEILGISDRDFTIEQNTVATNNHVYMISLSKPTESEKTPQNAKPFTVAVPARTSRLVMRIAKADNNVEDSVRIRNEVACLTLARKALTHVDPLLVPRVFGWDDDASDGYILQEFKPGELLSHADLRALGEHDLRSVCAQLAAVAKAWQDYRLPVEGYGGLTFDDDGRLSTTEIVFRTGGPFSTYTEYLKATLEWQLAQSESVAALNGWRDTPGLRERIDAFVANGLDQVLSKVPEYKPTLVHGDLTLPNLLFDRQTNRLVAVVDFDFGHVGSPITEFLYSFPEFQGILLGVAEPEDGLRDLVLNGFADGPSVDARFAIGKAWDDALAVQGVLRPCTIEGCDDVSNVWWFAQDLLQFHWLLPRFHESQSEEQIQGWVAKSQKRIEGYLEHWGY